MPARKDLKVAALSPTGTGDQTGIAAVASRSIVVVSFVIVASAATVVTFKSGTATNLSGPMSFAANSGISLTAADPGVWLFATAPGEAFTINQTVDGVDGFATYYLTYS